MALERTVKNKNIQVKEESKRPITDYAPPKGINMTKITNSRAKKSIKKIS